MIIIDPYVTSFGRTDPPVDRLAFAPCGPCNDHMAHVPEREHLQQRLCIGGKAQIQPIFGPTSTLLGENFSAAGCICGQAAMPCMIKASYNPVHACMPLLGLPAQCPNLFACAARTLAALCTCHAWKNLLSARLWYIVRACKQ